MVLKDLGIFCRTTWCGDGKYFPKKGDILHQRIFKSQGVGNEGGAPALAGSIDLVDCGD